VITPVILVFGEEAENAVYLESKVRIDKGIQRKIAFVSRKSGWLKNATASAGIPALTLSILKF